MTTTEHSESPKPTGFDAPKESVGSRAVSEARAALTPQRKTMLIYGLAVLGFLGAVWYIYDSWTHEETDNAYVTGHLHYVSPRISGVVQEVLVTDNQRVKQGDILLKLDPADYQVQFDKTKADYDKARLDFDRYTELAKINAVAQQDVDHARTDLDVAKANLDNAQLQLDYTVLCAPSDGRVGRKNVEVGNRVSPGQSLLVIVQEDVWVVANFKETQLASMKKDQPVTMTIDAIPGKTFRGTVESFAPASGNQFALLPADNSTGNFTKIVQRLPVKIRFDSGSIQGYDDRIRPGLSVIVKVAIH